VPPPTRQWQFCSSEPESPKVRMSHNVVARFVPTPHAIADPHASDTSWTIRNLMDAFAEFAEAVSHARMGVRKLRKCPSYPHTRIVPS